MKTLAEYKGYQLLERYDKCYIRFWGGREDDMPCEIPISAEEADSILKDTALIEDFIARAKEKIVWTAESFYKIGISEYFHNVAKMSDRRAEENYEKLSRHQDIRDEFYQYIMNETFPSAQVEIREYNAEKLTKIFPLSPLRAYNYLIYLRENPEQALADLNAGLPRRKIFSEKDVEQLKGAEK